MVYPISAEKQCPDTVTSRKRTIRKRKKKSSSAKKARKELFKKKDRFVVSMSSWAEHFTAASTWQIKHQLAYWKARAVSLEYENKILHDIIRKNCSELPPEPSMSNESVFRKEPVPKTYEKTESTSESEIDVSEEDKGQDEDNWEVSEEFVEFLRQNAKYKEDAKRERERLKAKMSVVNEIDVIEQLEAGPSGPPPDDSIELKRLYGPDWLRMGALETSVQVNFIHECDKSKAMHWPNIPFNFSVG